jgi:hypothetical protein
MFSNIRTTILCNFFATLTTLALANPASNIGVSHLLSKLHPQRRIEFDRLYQKVVDDLDKLLCAVGLKAA